MVQTLQVNNVKCGGCANTLKKSLISDFGDIQVDLTKEPREITLDLDDSRIEDLKVKLRTLGYPLVSDELSTFENVAATAKSFVSCSIGKFDNMVNN
jgi:copper chaperone